MRQLQWGLMSELVKPYNGSKCFSLLATIEKRVIKLSRNEKQISYSKQQIIFYFSCRLGVSKILVALMAGRPQIFSDRSKTSPQDNGYWITSLEFSTTLQTNIVGKTGRTLESGTAEVELQISGMTCSSLRMTKVYYFITINNDLSVDVLTTPK